MLSPDEMNMSESNSGDAEDTASAAAAAAAVAPAPSPAEEDDSAAAAAAPEPMGGSSPTKASHPPQAPPPPIDTAAAEEEAAEAATKGGTAPPEGNVVSPMPSDPPPSPPGGKDPWSDMVNSAVATVNGGGSIGAYERVEVTDPKQHGEGRQAYTSYHLTVHPTRADTKPTEVNRRYSDFQWLYRHLLRERVGAIVPIIPHMQALTKEGRLSEEVINFRRKSCEAWLNRIIRHPELHSSPSLTAFLKSDDDLFKETKRSGDVDFSDHGDEQTEDPAAANYSMEWGATTSPKTGGGGGNKKERFRRIKALATKVKSGLRSSSELERSDDEPAFDEIRDYVTELEIQVGWLSKHSTALVKTYKDQSTVLEALGSKFSSLGSLSFPNTHSSNSARLSTLLNKIGDGVSALGMNETGRYDELTERFDYPMRDLMRDVQSLKVALAQRKEVQIKYTDKVAKIQGKQNHLEKIQATSWDNPGQQEIREKEAHGALIEAEEAAKAKKLEFEAVTARMIREVERFRTQFRDSVRAVVREWATVQCEYYGRANKGWNDILPFLDAPELVEGDRPGGYSMADANGGSAGPQVDSV